MSRTYEQLEPVVSALDERIKTGLSAFPTDTAEGPIASFPDGADDIPLKSLVVDIDPVQDLSHGDPSPENICPISGWTEINAYNDPLYGGNIEWNQLCKCNILSATLNGLTYTNNGDGSVSVSGTATAITNIPLDGPDDNYIVPHHVYALLGCPQGGSQTTFMFGIGGLGLEYGGGKIWTNPNYSRGNSTFIVFANQTVNFQNMRFQIFDLTQMFGEDNEPSTVEEFKALFPNDYYPYNAGEKTTVSAVNEKPFTHVTIPFGQTVYGGKLDVLSGELVVYPYYASYNGETLTGEWISDRDKYVSGTTPTIGAQVVNIGAQGVTVQLEPHEVNSLLGVNNIWADSGDTEVEYRADTKLFIERLTAPDSADMIADANITSGQYFMVGNSLYLATSNIASGGQVIVGTNCTQKSLATALNEINQ